MKKLVVFYSLDGNTKFIAQNLAKKLGADILELKPEKEIPKVEPLKHFWGGKQVVMKETPKLQKYNLNLADYDTLIIGTPVWAFNFSPPIRTFLKENKIENKKIILFCTFQASPGKTFENLKKELSGNEIIAQIEFKSVLKNPKENFQKLEEFINKIKDKIYSP
jgi:flavodoxin